MSLPKKKSPPEFSRSRVHDHQFIAEMLKEDPGEWYLILENTTASIADHINKGAIVAYLPGGSFEAKRVGKDQTTGQAREIYARYIGAVDVF